MSSTTKTEASLPSLHDFFAPGGVLSRSPLPYEFRRGQLEMAQAVERALTDQRHLIVEAGTGTGKTLAYLLPALRMCATTGHRVIISTGTKNLQEQLFFKDIPFLESLLGPLRVCYMKGRANYLCRHKLFALRSQPILSGLEEISQYQDVYKRQEQEEVEIRLHSIIYELQDEIRKAMLGLLEPVFRENFLGRAEVLNVFRIPKVGTIAGCRVTDGVLRRDSEVRLMRDGVPVYKGKLTSLKRFKDDAKEVSNGMELSLIHI